MLFAPRIAFLPAGSAGPTPKSRGAEEAELLTSPELTYQQPPPALVALVDAPDTPLLSFSPDRGRLLLLAPEGLPPITELARPELRLAGLRIDPAAHGPSRQAFYTGLTTMSVTGGGQRPITGLPEPARIAWTQWSPDAAWLAIVRRGEEGYELWLAEVESGRARRLLGRLNAVYGRPCDWLPDSDGLVVLTVPEGLGPPPTAPAAPSGPDVQESRGRTAPARTYQDLLRNPYDDALFAHYSTSQVVIVDRDGRIEPIGEPDLISDAAPSPDGRYLLLDTVQPPFSRLVPVGRFGFAVDVIDRHDGSRRRIATVPVAEEVPIAFDAVRTGPRHHSWRPDRPAALTWVEAQDGGDPANEVAVRDRVFQLAAPFDGDPEAIAETSLRYGGIAWGEGTPSLLTETWWKDRHTRTWLFDPDRPGERRLLWHRSFEDRYSDPGTPVMRPNRAGRAVLATVDDGRSLVLFGAGASEEGDRPFIDRLDLETLATTRLWRCEAPWYEVPSVLLDGTGRRYVTRRESLSDPPNYFLRDVESGTLTPITDFPHPYPQMQGLYKELIHYQRADGLPLTATLYLPPGHQPGDGPLPLLMWAYPREYKSAAAAGQVRESPYRFPRIEGLSPLYLLAAGYAVLDGPALPIVGEGEAEANDTYIEQLVAGAKAAVDEVVRRGVATPDRIAIGGHSYGAFMAVNLLAHSELYRCGIARSGAYNRTLTPFGFQAEERTLWQAPEVYFAMSPFVHADRIRAPLLLIHGEADNNSGTYPMQSERLYNAIQGHGGTVRLVLLPHESHGYRARESVLHQLWEMLRWLDEHLRG